MSPTFMNIITRDEGFSAASREASSILVGLIENGGVVPACCSSQ